MAQDDESFKTRIPEIREVRETLRVPVEGYGLCTAMSRGGRVIAMGGMVPGQNGLIHRFDNTGKREWHHKTREAISTVAVSPNGEFIAAASDDNNIYFFDKRGLLQWRHESSRLVKAMALSENGDFLAVGSEDANLYFFDRNRQIKKFVWKFRFEGTVTGVAMASTGRLVAAGSADRTVALFDQNGQMLWSHDAQDGVTSVAMSADGSLIAAGSTDSRLYLFNGTGVLLQSVDCGAPVTSVAVSASGDCVLAAAGPEILCVDPQGVRLWSARPGSPIIRMAATELADAALVATEDKALAFVTRPGAVAWRHSGSGGIYGLAISDDREMALACGPGSLDYFESSKIFRELVSRHQLVLNGMKKAGQDVSAQEAALRSGIGSLGTRAYPAVAESLKEIQDSLLAMDRISEERQKLRDDTSEALARALASAEQARKEAGASEETAVKDLGTIMERAEGAFRAGKFGEALADIRKVEEALVQLRQNRTGRTELMMLIENIQGQILAARKLDVDVSAAEARLERARASLRSGNLATSSDDADEAATALHKARSQSPRAVQAGFEQALQAVDSPTAGETDLRRAEDGIAAAIPTLIKKRDLDTLAESYERLAAGWSRRPASPVVLAGAQAALAMAVAAHRDGGKLDQAIKLCRDAGDLNTAAKLLLSANDRERASECWTRAATTKKPRPSVPEDVRLRADAELAIGRYYESAAELARAGHLFEAYRVLGRAQPDGRNVAFVFRLLYNLQDIGAILERGRAWLPDLRQRARDTRETADLSVYAHVLVGTLEMARLLESPEARQLASELADMAHSYSRALSRDEIRASEVCDLTVLYAYLLEGNWKAVERLTELKGGPTWDRLRSAIRAWRDVDLKSFREHSRAFLLSRPGRVYWPTQTLPEAVPAGDIHQALDELAPFNHVLLIHNMLDKLANKDYIGGMVKRADAEMAAGHGERGAALYENALVLDTFGFLDQKRVHLRLAGRLLDQRMEADAAQHLEAAGAGREAALAEYRSLRGLLPVGGKRAGVAAKPTAPAPSQARADRHRCPKCGAGVPAKAIRCFKCGKSLK